MSAPDKKKAAAFKRIGYEPHAAQWLFHNSPARFKVPACGRRFGKSQMAAAELFTNPRANIFQEDKLFWIVGPKYNLAAKEFKYLRDFLRKLPGKTPGKSLWDDCPRKSFNVKQGDMRVLLPWETEVLALSAAHKNTLVGEGVDGLIVSEAAKQDRDVWAEYLRPTLADSAPNSWAAFPSTPNGYNWFYSDVFLPGTAKAEKTRDEYESWNFPAWLNPYVYPGGENDPEIQAMRDTMPEDVFWQEIGASFRSVVGLIYSEWDDELHIYDERYGRRYKYNPAWPNFTAIDWGYTHPTVILDIQVDPMDNVYVWREHVVARQSVPQHISAVRMRVNPTGYKVRCGYADAAYPSGVEEFSQALWPVYAQNEYKDWQRGVAEVKRLLMGEDGSPHLFVSRDCPNTIREFQNYRLKETSERQDAKEAPHKRDDDCVDALRYFVMGYFVFGGGRYSLADVMSPSITAIPSGEERGYFTLDEPTSAFTLGMNY